MSFIGQVVVVTGAASGMGKLAAQKYARTGKTVVGLDLNETGLQETAKGFSNFVTFSLDITDFEQVKEVVDKVEAEIGPIARLVNCAGIMPLGTISSQATPLIEKIMAVNYGGTVTTNKAVLPFMEKRGQGEIINFASIAGWAPSISMGAYNAAKFAVVAFSEVLHHENLATGIKVCCVCPPPVNTPLLHNAINVPKSLKGAAVVEPDYILKAMETSISKNELYCMPGWRTKLAYLTRRLTPDFVWAMVHKVEGKEFAKYLSRQPHDQSTQLTTQLKKDSVA